MTTSPTFHPHLTLIFVYAHTYEVYITVRNNHNTLFTLMRLLLKKGGAKRTKKSQKVTISNLTIVCTHTDPFINGLFYIQIMQFLLSLQAN